MMWAETCSFGHMRRLFVAVCSIVSTLHPPFSRQSRTFRFNKYVMTSLICAGFVIRSSTFNAFNILLLFTGKLSYISNANTIFCTNTNNTTAIASIRNYTNTDHRIQSTRYPIIASTHFKCSKQFDWLTAGYIVYQTTESDIFVHVWSAEWCISFQSAKWKPTTTTGQRKCTSLSARIFTKQSELWVICRIF